MRAFRTIATAVVVTAGAVAAVYALASADSAPAGTPTSQEVHRLISNVFDAAQARDRQGICEQSASAARCRAVLDNAEAAWPLGPPTTLCERKLEPSGSYAGGYALRLEGINSDGERYTSDVLAINTSEGPRLMNVAFWNSSGIAIANTTNSVFDVCGGS